MDCVEIWKKEESRMSSRFLFWLSHTCRCCQSRLEIPKVSGKDVLSLNEIWINITNS